MRTALDFSPLYRSMIGVDRMADAVEAAMRRDTETAYPPCNVEKTGEDSYRITLAVAGFAPENLQVVAQPNLLIVSGRRPPVKGEPQFLYRGFTEADFERRFELADFVVVKSATQAHGLLAIDLAREVPEPLKPRQVEITLKSAAKAEKAEKAEKPVRAA